MDQELVDARIDCFFSILLSVMEESEYYEKVRGLSSYGDLFGNADNIIDEKWGMFKGNMVSMTKEKNELIRNCEAKMRHAEIQAEKDSIDAISAYKKIEKH